MTARATVDGVDRVWDEAAQAWRNEREWPRLSDDAQAWLDCVGACPECGEQRWATSACPLCEIASQLIAQPSAKPDAACASAEVVEAVRAALRYPENGHHYCRGCSGGTSSGWVHDQTCSIVLQQQSVDAAREALKLIRTEADVRAEAFADGERHGRGDLQQVLDKCEALEDALRGLAGGDDIAEDVIRAIGGDDD